MSRLCLPLNGVFTFTIFHHIVMMFTKSAEYLESVVYGYQNVFKSLSYSSSCNFLIAEKEAHFFPKCQNQENQTFDQV